MRAPLPFLAPQIRSGTAVESNPRLDDERTSAARETRLLESLISLTLVGLFFLFGWAVQAPAETLILAGIGFAAFGFLYGIPTAIVYHWRLYRSLLACDRLPARWWLQPTALHDRIPSADRVRVLLWGAIGGSGFVLIVIGILLTSVGLWRTLTA